MDGDKKMSPEEQRGKPTVAASRVLVEDGSAAFGLLILDMTEVAGGYDHERFLAICAGIRARVERIERGETADLLKDLVGQLAWLSELLAHCARRGVACADRPSAADVWLRLALTAAKQHSRTAGILAAIAGGKLKAIND